MKKIGFLTYELEPKLTSDDLLAVSLLAGFGHAINPIIWDQCVKSELEEMDLLIFKSCWDFHLKIEKFIDFLTMLSELDVDVLNSPTVAKWNLDKKYLLDLQKKDILIPKTIFIERGSKIKLIEFFKIHGMSEAVIKPAISADGFETKRITSERGDELQKWFDKALSIRTMMIQEFVPEILTEGEISFIFFNGEFSHAVRKRPGTNEFRIQSQYGGTRESFYPTDKDIKKAKEIASYIGGDQLFARVDVIPVDNELILIELEAIDPFLFLNYSTDAPERFAAAICSRLGPN